MLLRRRALVIAAAAATALVAAVVVAATRAQSVACAAPAPRPSLDAQLLSLGDFGQPYDATDTASLQDAATRVAAALHPDLGSAQPGTPVAVARWGAQRYDALVVPLSGAPSPGGAPALLGMVAFLRDCAGHAYYSTTRDLVTARRGGPLPASFPAVGVDEARQRLQTSSTPRLVYGSSPFDPLWVARSGGATLPAMPAS